MGEGIKKIVVSAINFTEGGPLTVLKECLCYLSHLVSKNSTFKIIALVYDKELCAFPGIEYIEITASKDSWLKRVYIEYLYFYKLSKKIKPYLWLSLHDITPNVVSKKRVVYCHNPTPFYRPNWADTKNDFKISLFSLLYKYLYKINIHKNDFVIIQQKWLKDEFVDMFKLSQDKVIVAYPKKGKKEKKLNCSAPNLSKKFFFPSFPRVFKNFEVIGDAVILLKKRNIINFKVIFTINGTENKYSRWLFSRFGHLENINFIGKIDHDNVMQLYGEVDCLLFPSRLETWGLPISEFALYNKHMIIADLPYARETASSAMLVSFFNPYSPEELADRMEMVIKGETDLFEEVPNLDIIPPFTQSWEELFNIILN